MAEPRDPAAKDWPVRRYFHRQNRRTGDLAHYHPDGDAGWPGASAVFVGVPDSPVVVELLAGAGGQQGPLIDDRKDDPPAAVPAVPKPSAPSGSGTKKTTSTAVTAGKEN